uniref:Uncharacterized protein n=1 Tax=Chromera velia CCMP2878 TaxID=1169474 RepID=A0A0G4HS66_9ALVE|mmetsp:Transcript_25555/g.49993  ORF Transcript_25555/g.49993 Transcript_25555/m.49993 type:complete len:281 (+) Transcript_25555:88-930(+)|eukprot:Cvel_1316.t1-p1 / transcript=Cvel_1316.t1 / gene=Cvel_1316 / organism=Chromera_velia_CCMP2878 / gene_product=hypothetical protein / transcript_product=hypothetical protein / location=Cvel_scaffold44:164369-165781(+) / protein_length=280 / sequence_SO=supercontig / SO=protein_coding / is_pseudo=false
MKFLSTLLILLAVVSVSEGQRRRDFRGSIRCGRECISYGAQCRGARAGTVSPAAACFPCTYLCRAGYSDACRGARVYCRRGSRGGRGSTYRTPSSLPVYGTTPVYRPATYGRRMQQENATETNDDLWEGAEMEYHEVEEAPSNSSSPSVDPLLDQLIHDLLDEGSESEDTDASLETVSDSTQTSQEEEQQEQSSSVNLFSRYSHVQEQGEKEEGEEAKAEDSVPSPSPSSSPSSMCEGDECFSLADVCVGGGEDACSSCAVLCESGYSGGCRGQEAFCIA